jgi:hypothetical protein
MTIPMPRAYAELMRQKRLAALGLFSIVFFGLALFGRTEFSMPGLLMMGYIGVILTTYRLPLQYRLTKRGIYVTSPIGVLTVPLLIATNFWCVWLFDKVSVVERRNYEGQPALLIRTKRNPGGVIRLPVHDEDIAAATSFLTRPATEIGTNAVS